MKAVSIWATIFAVYTALGSAQAAEVSRSWYWLPTLGLYAMPMDEALAKDLKQASAKGVFVLAMAEGGAGDKADIRPGDVLLEFSSALLTKKDVTETVALTREGKTLRLSVTSADTAMTADHRLMVLDIPQRSAGTFVVDPSGAGDYRTLSGALARTVSGDRILVKPGIYREAFFLNSGVTVEAETKGLVRLEGTNVELARKMLAESGKKIIAATDLTDAAQKVVATLKA